MKIRFYIAATFLFCSSFLHAQDFAQLIRGMRSDYEQSKTLQIVMEITIYDSAQVSAPYYKQIIDIRREGNNYWYQLQENEMLLNEKYLIVVDKQSKLISYSKRSLETEAELQKSFQFNLDTILRQYEKPLYLGKEEDAEHYLVKEKNGPIEEVHFYIVPKDYVLKKMAYTYRGGQHVFIRFIVFDKKALFDADTFSETKYVVKVNDKIVPSRFYKQYDIQYQ